MTTKERLRRKAMAVLLGSTLAVGATLPARATGIPVVDVAAIIQMILDQITQNAALGEQAAQTLQMYQDYSLQQQNLAALQGNVRTEVEANLRNQIANNIVDFGTSFLNSVVSLDPNSPSYYGDLEAMYRTAMGHVPRPMENVNSDLAGVGLAPGTDSAMGHAAYADRVQWERVMDDMRQVSLTRKNAVDRSTQARNIAREMRNLPSNNTVGAIQLLSAQNALNYAQNEDLIKNQAALLKVEQEKEARLLAEREELRQLEIARLKKLQKSTFPSD